MEEKRIQLSEKDINKSFTLGEIWQTYQKQIYFILGGLVLVSIILLVVLSPRSQEPTIQIIDSEENHQTTIFVDLEGEVQKPGVYEMPADSRLNDLLIRSGGLSAKADREWITTNLNLAQKLVDGAKIYIPERSEVLRSLGGGGQAKNVPGKTNINTASLAELDNLQGIGEKRAADIIKNRPYQTIEELIKRKVIPQSIYEKIKDEIVAY